MQIEVYKECDSFNFVHHYQSIWKKEQNKRHVKKIACSEQSIFITKRKKS